MKMPGFVAETSLYKSSGHYNSEAVKGYSDRDQAVVSQFSVSGRVGDVVIEPEQCDLRCKWICGRYGCFPYDCYWNCY